MQQLPTIDILISAFNKHKLTERIDWIDGISAYHSGAAHIVKNAVQSCCIWILIANQDNVWHSRFISSLIISFSVKPCSASAMRRWQNAAA